MITSLSLKNFRSYTEDSFEFETGVNIIIGPNTSGKTNLLEAVLVVCQGKTYRGNSAQLVQKGKTWARLEATTEGNQARVAKIKLTDDRASKEYEIDGKRLSRLSLGQKIPVIVFEPNQLQQLTSSPQQRRDLLDDLLEQTEPGFATLRRDYVRSLSQRNRLLKTGHNIARQIFPWDVRLSELGGKIAEARQQISSDINKNISDAYSGLAGKDYKAKVSYESAIPTDNYANKLLSILGSNLQKDIERGFTGAGPHRDDLILSINGTNIQSGASRGEVRTMLLALKMQESQIIQEKLGARPLLLLDDVFGELDGRRRKALIKYFKDHQTFITTTDADVVGKTYVKQANKIALGS